MAASANRVRQISSDSEFKKELSLLGEQLVVVDFFATWCGPCRVVAPKFEELSVKYTSVCFWKLDVDRCKNTASRYEVKSIPTFVLFRNREVLHTVKGADIGAVEAAVAQHVTTEESSSVGKGGVSVKGAVSVPGQHILNTFVDKTKSECLNEADDHPFTEVLVAGPQFLQSDCDEQLILYLTFGQSVKLHSLLFKAAQGKTDEAPKTVKIFLNQIGTPSFDDVERMKAVQEFELAEDDVSGDTVVPLVYVKFQRVESITVFIKDNQGGGECTVLEYLGLYGSPLDVTNMREFKRIAGEKGESH